MAVDYGVLPAYGDWLGPVSEPWASIWFTASQWSVDSAAQISVTGSVASSGQFQPEDSGTAGTVVIDVGGNR